jgi:anaerobic ribonucleoside-triphosphate reductase activating protein
MVMLSRLHHPVTVLGFGTRVGVWFQGCAIGCRGCISQDTWNPGNPDDAVPVENVLGWIQERGPVDGLTVSGGEPFDQSEALAALVEGFRALPTAAGADVLIYSGYTATALQRRHGDTWRIGDATITGPYLAARPGDALRGSGNQEIHLHTDLGQARYGSSPPAEGKVQVAATGGQLWMIGIPAPGDMAGLEERLSTRGVKLSDVSWRC